MNPNMQLDLICKSRCIALQEIVIAIYTNVTCSIPCNAMQCNATNAMQCNAMSQSCMKIANTAPRHYQTAFLQHMEQFLWVRLTLLP